MKTPDRPNNDTYGKTQRPRRSPFVMLDARLVHDGRWRRLDSPSQAAYIDARCMAFQGWLGSDGWDSAENFGYAVPTAAAHLDALVEVGLMVRRDDGSIGFPEQDIMGQRDPTNPERQARHRAKRKAEDEALRNALRNQNTTQQSKTKQNSSSVRVDQHKPEHIGTTLASMGIPKPPE